MIVARGGTEKYDKVYAFSTFMYSTYKVRVYLTNISVRIQYLYECTERTYDRPRRPPTLRE